MRIHERGVVFLGAAGGDDASACFPGVCVLPSGRWLVAFRAAPRKADGRVLVVYYAGPTADHTGLYWVRAGT